MITLDERLSLLLQLSTYLPRDKAWSDVKLKANQQNGWFVEPFIDVAISGIINEYLEPGKLKNWIANYDVPQTRNEAKSVGIVMAGNIPLVGFHDFLCGFLSGHNMLIKRSSKDSILVTHIVSKLAEWDNRVNDTVVFSEMLKGCDAYIATGSNNSGRYFEYYFRNYASIIRRNRSSVAILTGNESVADLENLAKDMLLYFGLGCRSVSKIYAPAAYNFEPLLTAMKQYQWMDDHQKFKNNYDYNLSLLLLNNQYYMTNGIVLLVENASVFSPISQVHIEYYEPASLIDFALNRNEIQCIVGQHHMPFGFAQFPALSDFADGVDTMNFLCKL